MSTWMILRVGMDDPGSGGDRIIFSQGRCIEELRLSLFLFPQNVNDFEDTATDVGLYWDIPEKNHALTKLNFPKARLQSALSIPAVAGRARRG